MTLKFSRIQGGEYQVNIGSKMVGYIKKQTASKWIMYRATNPSMLGAPISVKKTLKDLKIDAEAMLNSVEINENSSELDSLITSIKEGSDRMDIMKELLEKDNIIRLSEYKYDDVTDDDEDDIFVDVPFDEFLTESELCRL
jgi:hypothetical protein